MENDVGQQILAELKRQTRLQTWMTAVPLLILVVFLFVFLPFEDRILAPFKSHPQCTDSWRQARTLLDQGETEKGKEMIERLLRKYPDYYYGHSLLGSVYQEMGNPEAAEKSYARAVDLFPDEDNEKTLAAIRKAIERKNQTANQASQAIGAPGAPQPER